MRALVSAAGGVIRRQDLTLSPASLPADTTLASLDDVEREQVVRVLAATGGQKSRAADILGVSRPRLNRLLAKYGLT